MSLSDTASRDTRVAAPAAAGGGVVVLDADGRVTHVSPLAAAILGVDPAVRGPRPAAEVFGPLADADGVPLLDRVAAGGESVRHEAFDPVREAWLDLQVAPAGGGWVVVVSDVTPRRMAEDRAAAALARLDLLDRVSDALAATDDPDEAVGRLARLVIPALADWSFVTVIEDDGRLRDLGLAHRDPLREDDLAAYSARHLQEMTPTAAVSRALNGASHVVVPRLSPEILESFIPDPAAAALTRRLDPHGVTSIALTARGRTFGALTLVTTSPRGPHTAAEVETGLEVARRAAPVLEAARVAQRARTLAETLQRSVLTVGATRSDLAVETRYRPASHDRQVGGDWYDTFALPDGSAIVTIGDVMGHDVAAIAAMSQLRTLLRGMAWTLQQSPSDVLATADQASFGLDASVFATAFTAHLHPAGADGTVRMTWSNAGHLPPFLLRAGRRPLPIAGRPDRPLGVTRDGERHDRETTLRPGDVVLLYTDGLVERRDEALTDSIDGLGRALAGVALDDLGLLLDTVLADLTGGRHLSDDVALLAVRVLPTGGHARVERRASDGFTPVLDLRVPADDIAPAIGREHVRREGSHLGPEQVADAELLVSELLSNAVRHGAAPIVLRMSRSAGALRVEVSDTAAGRPVVHAPRVEDLATSGRGLLLTDALASAWGVAPHQGDVGKTVWFRVDAGS